MGIVLFILKIIGIALLSLLGVALVLILFVLFWPFSYRIKGYKQEEDFDAAIRLLWLLGLVTATVNYNGEAWIKFRVCGIPVYKLKIWPVEEKEKSDEESLGEKSMEENGEVFAPETEEALRGDDREHELFDAEYEDCEMLSEEDINREIEERWNDDSEEDLFEKLPFWKKIKAFIDKIKEFILKCRQKCYNIKDSMDEFIHGVKKKYKEIRYYIKLIQHPCIKPALKKLWKCIKRFLKHVKPRQVKANIVYGSGAPASTMKVYGYYCMIYPFYGKKIKFTPDMEEKILHFDVKIAGHIQIMQALFFGWKLFADRNFRKLIRLAMREVKRRGRK